jgi:hypothetical protein
MSIRLFLQVPDVVTDLIILAAAVAENGFFCHLNDEKVITTTTNTTNTTNTNTNTTDHCTAPKGERFCRLSMSTTRNWIKGKVTRVLLTNEVTSVVGL